MKLLLTGSPGVGKTTLVEHLVHELKDLKVAGFITQELRVGGKRVGFDLISLPGGEKTALARIDTKERGPKVGQYTVCVDQFEVLALKSLCPSAVTGCDFVIIDEVGKMENFSTRLIRRIRELFSEDRKIIATVPLPGRGKILPIVQELCDRTDSELIEVDYKFRNRVAGGALVYTVGFGVVGEYLGWWNRSGPRPTEGSSPRDMLFDVQEDDMRIWRQINHYLPLQKLNFLRLKAHDAFESTLPTGLRAYINDPKLDIKNFRMDSDRVKVEMYDQAPITGNPTELYADELITFTTSKEVQVIRTEDQNSKNNDTNDDQNVEHT